MTFSDQISGHFGSPWPNLSDFGTRPDIATARCPSMPLMPGMSDMSPNATNRGLLKIKFSTF